MWAWNYVRLRGVALEGGSIMAGARPGPCPPGALGPGGALAWSVHCVWSDALGSVTARHQEAASAWGVVSSQKLQEARFSWICFKRVMGA